MRLVHLLLLIEPDKSFINLIIWEYQKIVWVFEKVEFIYSKHSTTLWRII